MGAVPTPPVVIRLLGPVEVLRNQSHRRCRWDQTTHDPRGASRASQRGVSVDRLIDKVWREDVPERSRDTLQAISLTFARALAAAAPDITIERKSPGYVLRVPGACVDADASSNGSPSDAERSRRARTSDAATCLGAALDTWTGEALAGIDAPSVPRSGRASNTPARRRRGLGRSRARPRTPGRGDPSARSLARRRPYRERATGQLMIALYRMGRQADAGSDLRPPPLSPRRRLRSHPVARAARPFE